MKRERLYGPAAFALAWYVVVYLGVINPLFLPPPHAVAAKLIQMLGTLHVWLDIAASTARIIVGFVASVIVGVPVGLLMGYSSRVHLALELLVDFFRSLPALAMFPLLMFFFGIGDAAKIGTAVFACALTICVNTIYGVTGSRKTRQIVALLMEANKREIFSRVVFMDALPQVFVGMRTSLSLAIVVIIVTEMFIGTTWGIGHRIFESQLTYRVPEMYASIVLTGILGYCLNRGFVAFEGRAVHWSGK